MGNTQSLQPILFSVKVFMDKYTVTAAQSIAQQNTTVFFLIL